MKAVQAILFDIDGTLAETDDFYIHLLAEKISRVLFFFPFGRLLGITRVLVMAVQTLNDAVYWLLDKIHLDFLYHKLHNRIATAKDKYRYQLIRGVAPALTILNQRYKLGILTAGGEHSTRLFLRDFDLTTTFQTVVSANSCIRTKPSPEPLLWAAQQLNIPPENCLMIGDTIFDWLTANRAGAQFIAVRTGFDSDWWLKLFGVKNIIDSAAELPEILS